MTSLLQLIRPAFRPMGTVALQHSPGALAPNTDNPDAYAQHLWAALQRGGRRGAPA